MAESSEPEISVRPGARVHGHLDAVERDRIEGWAQNLDHPDTTVFVRIFDNGIPLADIPARLFREDLVAAGIGNGEYAFRFEFPVPLGRRERHVIDVRVAADGIPLPGSPHVIEGEADPPSLPIIECKPAPWRGSLDVVTRERVDGWAWDPAAPEAPLSLTVLDNGELIAKVIANRYRKDLETAGIGNGRHGFSWIIPGGLTPFRRHVIQVLGEVDGCEMPSSPVVIPTSESFNESMQTAIKAAIDGMASNTERAGALHFLADEMERLLQKSADGESVREARLIRQGLARRWGKRALAEESVQSVAIAAAAARRALVIDDRVPLSERDAGSNAILSHMRALRALGFDVSFVSAATMAGDDGATAALEGRGIHHCRLPYYASIEEVLQRQAGCFDLVYIHRATIAARYLALASHYNGRARVIYSVADLHFLRVARQAKVEGRPALAALSARLRRIELSAAAQANAVITHSTVEAEVLRQAVPRCNVHIVPWAVPLGTTPRPWSERRGVAFIGGFDHAPNLDAAQFLVEQIMPRVWRTAPDIPCLLVGSSATSMIEGLASERVLVLGHVPQIASVFDRARLTVAPLRYGAGVKGKVLESLAAGVPCIMSPIAAEGIPLPESLADMVVADVEGFAAQILRQHEDEAAAATAGQAGRDLIDGRYSDAVVIELLRAVVDGQRAVVA